MGTAEVCLCSGAMPAVCGQLSMNPGSFGCSAAKDQTQVGQDSADCDVLHPSSVLWKVLPYVLSLDTCQAGCSARRRQPGRGQNVREKSYIHLASHSIVHFEYGSLLNLRGYCDASIAKM